MDLRLVGPPPDQAERTRDHRLAGKQPLAGRCGAQICSTTVDSGYSFAGDAAAATPLWTSNGFVISCGEHVGFVDFSFSPVMVIS